MKNKEQYYLYRLEKCKNNSYKIIKYSTEVISDSNDDNLYYAHYPSDNEIVSEELVSYNEKNNSLGDIYDISFAGNAELTINDGIPVFLIGSCDKNYCLLFDTRYNNEYFYGYFPIKGLTVGVVQIVSILVIFYLIVKYLLLI